MPKITTIDLRPVFPQRKRTGLYCRVSSTLAPQLQSLAQQISYLTKMVMHEPWWLLTDIYIDVKSGEAVSNRPQFMRLIGDCKAGLIDLVIAKNISRFSRDAAELLSVIRELRAIGVEVLFEQEMLSTADNSSELMISVIEAIAQADNDSRSKNVRWAIVKRAQDCTSALYKRRCYGYYTDSDGELRINEEEAAVVRSIFDMYLSGLSLVGIIRALEAEGAKTPTGKDKWSKRTLDQLLSNDKYSGDVTIFKTYTAKEYSPFKAIKRKDNHGEHERYVSLACHPAIISKDDFDAVQAEKARRSNVEAVDGEWKRKSTHYSVKRDAPSAGNG